MKITINSALVMRATLQERAKDLKDLLQETAVEKRRSYGGDDKEILTPKYDVRSVDAILTMIKLAVFEIDSATKQSNAVTMIDIPDVDFKRLMQPIENAK